MELECYFTEAIYWSEFYEELRLVEEYTYPIGYDATDFDWEYSKMVCNNEVYELIENPTTLASFYLEKSFTYGDFFLMGFLTLFSLAIITKIIWQIFAKK